MPKKPIVAMASRTGFFAAVVALVGAVAADDTLDGFVHGDEVFFTVPATDHRITVEDNGFVNPSGPTTACGSTSRWSARMGPGRCATGTSCT